MMLISIITIGFLRIMSLEQRQALDNDLSASALTAAESGVEDAKRAIIKYNTLNPTSLDKTHWRTVLSSSSCNAIFTDTAISAALNLNTSGLVGQPSLNQYYTCLTVNLNSPDYISHANPGKSEFIPLRPAGGSDFDQIKVSWHLLSNSIGNDGDGIPGGYPPNQLLPPVTGGATSWTNGQYPAYLRAEIFGYPNGSFNRSDIDNRTHSVFLVPNAPGTAGAVNETTSIHMDTIDPRGIDQGKPGVQGVQCKLLTPPPVGSYACVATLELPSDPALRGVNNNYYLRLTPIYGVTHFKVELQKSGTGIINFSEVQPIIDSTGKANDVFRRIQTRVKLTGSGLLPEYSVESVNDICKDMKISDGSYYQNNCPALP